MITSCLRPTYCHDYSDGVQAAIKLNFPSLSDKRAPGKKSTGMVENPLIAACETVAQLQELAKAQWIALREAAAAAAAEHRASSHHSPSASLF